MTTSIDKEALAYSECVAALKVLHDPDSSLGYSAYSGQQRVKRVLASLAQRWGFQYVDHQCDAIRGVQPLDGSA